MPQVSALLAALAGFGGGLALLTGLLFRPAMVPLCFTILVAAFVGEGGKGFDVTRGDLEYPLTQMFAVAALFCTGSGRYVVDPTTRAQEALAS
jgi:uncharacterized membrane protein YphA (DoxX/SURF4 family)